MEKTIKITKTFKGNDGEDRKLMVEETLSGNLVAFFYAGKVGDFQNKMKGGVEDEL